MDIEATTNKVINDASRLRLRDIKREWIALVNDAMLFHGLTERDVDMDKVYEQGFVDLFKNPV